MNRETIAFAILKLLIAEVVNSDGDPWTFDDYADQAFKYADAFIKRRGQS